MRRHSELGRDIVGGAGMDDIARYVHHLHERYDGSGYPEGLAGDDIPLESRILHVADAYEAMTSSRVYRDALCLEDAVAELEKGAGTQFDPAIAKAMIGLVHEGVIDSCCEGLEPCETPEELVASPGLNGHSSQNGDVADAQAPSV
jgi:HD-GYP domain-containing protein (c-di-GMP phosphodiesterase class II)